jgi:hypothetical protein
LDAASGKIKSGGVHVDATTAIAGVASHPLFLRLSLHRRKPWAQIQAQHDIGPGQTRYGPGPSQITGLPTSTPPSFRSKRQGCAGAI